MSYIEVVNGEIFGAPFNLKKTMKFQTGIVTNCSLLSDSSLVAKGVYPIVISNPVGTEDKVSGFTFVITPDVEVTQTNVLVPLVLVDEQTREKAWLQGEVRIATARLFDPIALEGFTSTEWFTLVDESKVYFGDGTTVGDMMQDQMDARGITATAVMTYVQNTHTQLRSDKKGYTSWRLAKEAEIDATLTVAELNAYMIELRETVREFLG